MTLERRVAPRSTQSPEYRCSCHGSPYRGSRSPPRTPAHRDRGVEPAHPFRALPEVEMRHQQPRRAAVLRLERLSVEAEGDPRFAARKSPRAEGSSCSRRRRTATTYLAAASHALEQRVERDALHCVSSFDHLVTQWMSCVIVSCGRARNSSHVQRARLVQPPASVKLHASGVRGGGPPRARGSRS